MGIIARKKSGSVKCLTPTYIYANDIKYIRTVKMLSELILERQSKLLAHVMRRDERDLLRQPTIDLNLQRPYQLKKRTGRPKLNWVEETLKQTFTRENKERLYPFEEGTMYDPQNELHVNFLQHWSRRYAAPAVPHP